MATILQENCHVSPIQSFPVLKMPAQATVPPAMASSAVQDIPNARSPAGPIAPAGIIVGAAIFLTCSTAVMIGHWTWEYQLISTMNAYAGRSAVLDRSIHALTSRDLLEGVPFISLLWYLWFGTTNLAIRARLLAGTIAASCAGVVSRLLQLALPTHLRPLHTTTLGFVLPFGVEPDALNHFDSFPSDHGAVFFGLALVIYQARPSLGVAAFIWAAIVDIARIYEGFHFPSDILGSVGLAVLLVSVSRGRWCHSAASRVLRKEQTAPALFYMFAFLVSYQIATLFDDVREVGRGFASVVLHHDPFGG
jgi:membrane-associated phospholipid phosphatase